MDIDEITIKVWRSEEGFMFDILDGDNSVDGGLCTTIMQSAVGMACAQANMYVDKFGRKAVFNR